MNNRLSITFLLFIFAPLLFGCGGPAKEKNKNNASANSLSWHDGDEKYVVVDTTKSVVTWKGSNSFGAHTGYVSISKGELMMDDAQLMGGIIEVDMNTIEDDNHQRDNGLILHLKDADFFDVKKFPSASIVITSVASINIEDKEITGSLTIKGITHPVTFPAKLKVKDGIIETNGRLVIDRTKWGVRYGSGKLFDNFKDQTISDDVEFNVKIVSKK